MLYFDIMCAMKRHRQLNIGFETENAKATRAALSGALQFATACKGLRLLFIDPDADAFRCDPVKFFQRTPLDGIIASSIMRHIPKRIPFVRLNPLHGNAPEAAGIVQLDDRALVTAAAQLLIRRGHAAFAYVGSVIPKEMARSDYRARLFAEALAAEHKDAPIVAPGGATPQPYGADIERLAAWLKTLPKPCGILAYADNRARTVIDACHFANINIPGQISLIGIDNELEICENVLPRLTSVAPDFEESGVLAMKMLLRILGSNGKKIVRSASYGVRAVVERETTQDLRGGGRLVSLATAYLRAHFREQALCAETLANRYHISRRLLDLRFKEILGRSVHAELKRLRLEQALQMLTSTDSTVVTIATACGYKSDTVFRAAFKSYFGKLPVRPR